MEEDNLSDESGNMDDSDDDYEEPVASTSQDSIPHNFAQNDDIPQRKKKRKRKEGRKRIRKILSQQQLDSETLSAQKEEQERLRRLELQKSLNTVPTARITPPLNSPNLDTVKVPDKPVLVNIPSQVTDKVIMIIDDSDDDCDIVEMSPRPVSGCVIISDSESEESNEEDNEADEEPENSGSHTNDDVNQPDAQGRVLVNVNHPPSEPDIFLASHLCTLVKPHQIGGIRFLYDNLVESLSRYQASPGFGCILAHSMGLGKTLQLICFIDVFLQFTKATKVLCIVPMNTIQNWFNEFNMWLPEASEAGETSEGLTEEGQEKQAKWEKQGGVLLMGYEMYRILAMYTPSLVNNAKLTGSKRKRTNPNTTEVIDLDEEEKNMDLLLEIQKSLCKPGPDLVVCDEGHRIKNNQANISQALKKIHTRRRVVLTGYPLQNNLMEYWCMVDFVRPNFLGTKHEFSNMFERPIVNGQCVDSTASDIKLMRFRAHVLHSLLEGFVQRRSEAILTKTLPQKEEYVIHVKMTSIQMSLYKSYVSSVKNYVGYINPIKAFGICIKIWNHPDILKSYLDSRKEANRNDSPLTVCDPDLDIGVTLSKKTKEPKNDVRLQPGSSSEPTLIPPDLKAMANSSDWVGDLMDNYEAGVLQHGAKMVLLMEIIEKSVQLGDKMLVFSQSLSTLSIIEDFLRKRVVPPWPSQLIFQPVHWERNKNYYRLDGGTSSQEREKLITAFNSKTNKSVFLFLLSTRACSLGVNLIGANRVVIFDASWNPCHDAQAVCRIYRYGQTKRCFIYRLVSHGTFEKRMYERQVTKEGMSDRVIDELNPEANLTKQEVMHLFKEGSDEEDDALVISSDAFPDVVLNHVCRTCQKSIFEIPFKHKLQSSHKPKNILTKAEKREAKKGYEREKRARNSANKYNSSSTTCSPLV
ncbi:helicase ARIP4-like isoform X1, partial [Paramuricea clavata]